MMFQVGDKITGVGTATGEGTVLDARFNKKTGAVQYRVKWDNYKTYWCEVDLEKHYRKLSPLELILD